MPACLQSLSFPQMGLRESNVPDPHVNTLNWLFEDPHFRAWCSNQDGDSHQRLFWLKGSPGSGKSVAMKAILRNMQRRDSTSIILSFFFNKRGASIENSGLGLYRSLVHQLFSQRPSLVTMADIVSKYHVKQSTLRPGWEWHEKELSDLLFRAVTNHECNPVIILLDALDEGSDDLNLQEIVNFFSSLTVTAHRRNSRVKICFSSRYYPMIIVKEAIEISLGSINAKDILTYVTSELQGQSPEEVKLAEDLATRAFPSFLWAFLATRRLLDNKSRGATTSQLREALDQIPQALDGLFEDIIRKIRPNEQDEAFKLFCLVIFSERPLSLAELQDALNLNPHKDEKSTVDVEQMRRFVQSRSGGLLRVAERRIDPHASSLRYEKVFIAEAIHETVNEYLKMDGFGKWDVSFRGNALGIGQMSLVSYCLNYLKSEEFEILCDLEQGPTTVDSLSKAENVETGHRAKAFKDVSSRRNFLNYAVHSLFIHTRKAEMGGAYQDTLPQEFGSPSFQLFNLWRSIWDLYSAQRGGRLRNGQTHLLHVAAEHDLTHCVSELLAAGVDANLKGGLYDDPLKAAAAHGSIGVAAVLLDYGAIVDCKDSIGWTALHLASRFGSPQLVELLLLHKADINARAEAGWAGWTALHAAAEQGHLDIATLLLDRGADVNARMSYPPNPTAQPDEQSLVALPGSPANDGETPLYRAAKNGHSDVVGLLFQRGASIFARSQQQEPVLCLAGRGRHWEVVTQLIQQGADVGEAADDGSTILHAAARWGQVDLVSEILDLGAIIEAKTVNGVTALHEAVVGGPLEVVRMLLSRGVNVNSCTHSGSTALFIAASACGSIAMAQLLLQQGADVNAKISDGRTALFNASTIMMLDLFERYHADMSARSSWGTALHDAISGFKDIEFIWKLICMGADVLATTTSKETMLHLAAEHEREPELLELLLQFGIDNGAKNLDGETALDVALRRLEWGAPLDSVVELLSNSKPSIEQDIEGKTPPPGRGWLKSTWRRFKGAQPIVTKGGKQVN